MDYKKMNKQQFITKLKEEINKDNDLKLLESTMKKVINIVERVLDEEN